MTGQLVPDKAKQCLQGFVSLRTYEISPYEISPFKNILKGLGFSLFLHVKLQLV